MNDRKRARATWARVLPLTILLLAGCTAASDEAGEPPIEPAPPVEEPAPEDEDEPEAPDEPAAAVALFFVRTSVDRQWVEPETHWIVGATEPDLASALGALGSAAPRDPALSTAVPSGLDVLSVTIEGAVAMIDLGAAITGHSTGSAGEIAFAEQLAHTARELAGVEAIQLTVGGEPITELWGHLGWSQPYFADPFALTPITIENPDHDATVPPGAVTFDGQATVFEATFMVRLRDAAGTLLEEGPVMADQGAPERGRWSVTFTIDAPGDYVLEAEEDDPSGGEGRAPAVIQRHFRVVAPAS